jgi:hypothetical protein
MNRDDIIRTAREAGLGTVLCHNSVEGDRVWIEGADWHDELERFAELLEAKVRADEREACAKVIENDCHDDMTRAEEAAAIRARGEK